MSDEERDIQQEAERIAALVLVVVSSSKVPPALGAWALAIALGQWCGRMLGVDTGRRVVESCANIAVTRALQPFQSETVH